MQPMIHTAQCTGPGACLLMPFELGQRSWKLGFTVGVAGLPSRGRRRRPAPASQWWTRSVGWSIKVVLGQSGEGAKVVDWRAFSWSEDRGFLEHSDQF